MVELSQNGQPIFGKFIEDDEPEEETSSSKEQAAEDKEQVESLV